MMGTGWKTGEIRDAGPVEPGDSHPPAVPMSDHNPSPADRKDPVAAAPRVLAVRDG